MTFCITLNRQSSYPDHQHALLHAIFPGPGLPLQVEYDGLISKICKEQFTMDKTLTSSQADSCWQVNEGKHLCSGMRCNLQDLIVSIPIILAIEVGNESVGLNHHSGSE